ncbi:MAG: tetratricopeptide repeat protein [Deltaproteobacteria bacterium]|nr:tetratricopeptide repeat protein [Deltaproteobacteria bacterium]
MPLWLFAALALGAPDTGRFVLHPTPGSRVVLFPRSEPLRIELGVYDNAAPLNEQLDGKTARWVEDVDVVAVGSGIWFVTLYVERPDIGITWEQEENRLILSLQPGLPAEVELVPFVTVAQLVSGDVPRRPAPVEENALRPLYGDASTLVLNADDYIPDVPRWNTGRVPSPWRDLALAPRTPNHDSVDRYRSAWTSSTDRRVREVALYRLGTSLQQLSMQRDALYYLNLLEGERERVPLATVHLEQARALMHLRRWDEARDACEAAWKEGAGDTLTLRCLGTVSLKTSNPPPTETARAIADTDPEPLSQLIAAQLLIRDRRYDEAATLLAPLARRAEDNIASIAYANLGDTLLVRGDLEGAARAWNRARGGNTDIIPLLNTRGVLLQMVKEGPSTWPSHIPELERMTQTPGAPGAEAHYLLAQIATTYGDQELAAEHLGGLIDRHKELALSSDVPERLYATASWRIDDLLRQDRLAEAVGFYRDYWRDALEPLVYDTHTLDGVARGLEQLGLYQEALDVQRDIAAVDIRYDRDDPVSLWRLAALYARTEHLEEATQTIAYVNKLPRRAPATGLQLLLEGGVYHVLGDDETAARAWSKASSDPVVGPEALTRLALLRASTNMCQLALPKLEGVLGQDPAPVSAQLYDEAGLARARCLLELGRVEDALAQCSAVAATSQDPGAIEEARYLASVLTTEAGGSELPQPLRAPDPTWDALLKEERESAEFLERIQPKLKKR